MTRSLLVTDAGQPANMAFTTPMLFQMFNVFYVRSDTHSAFYQLFHNPLLFGAVALSILLQVAVI